MFWLTRLFGNVLLAGQIVIVDNSSVGSEVMYGFDLAGNGMWKGHKWEGNIQLSLCRYGVRL